MEATAAAATVDFVVVVPSNNESVTPTIVVLDVDKDSGLVHMFKAFWTQPEEITCAQEYAFDNWIVDSGGDNDYIPIHGHSVERLKDQLGVESCKFVFDEVSNLWVLVVTSISPGAEEYCAQGSLFRLSLDERVKADGDLVDMWLAEILAASSRFVGNEDEQLVNLLQQAALIDPKGIM